MSLENIDPNATQAANDSAQTTGTALSLDTLRSGAPAHGPQLDSTPNKVQLAAADREQDLSGFVTFTQEADRVETLLKAGLLNPGDLGLPPKAVSIVKEMLGPATKAN